MFSSGKSDRMFIFVALIFIFLNMGHYVNNHLIRDESVAFETRLHWITFLTLKSLLTLTIKAWFDRWISEFVITNRRIIIKTGIIGRKHLK